MSWACDEPTACDLARRAADGAPAPSGLRTVGTRRGRTGFIPDVQVRCCSQSPDAPPLLSRPRLAWNRDEVSGALGDLGTFLPHILGAIAVVGMAPTGVLTGFGLLYLASGLFYGVPMGVQPMKAASAAVLIQRLEPGEIVGAGLVIGAFFLLLGVTGLINRVTRIVPPPVTAGLQLGIGLSLTVLGVQLVVEQPWLGIAIGVLILILLNNRRFPAALVALAVGIGLTQVTRTAPPFPPIQVGLHLPSLAWPTWEQVVRGTELAVIPQIPLTLTNAIIVTTAVTRQLFPKEVHHVNERNLSLSTGLGNLLTAPFGGYLMCHGAGGIAGHFRFGARTATAPVLIGLVFLALGVLLGDSAISLLALIPSAVLGGLLFFSGVELVLSSKVHTYTSPDLFAVLLVGAICVVSNAAIAFAVGLPLAYVLRRGLIRL